MSSVWLALLLLTTRVASAADVSYLNEMPKSTIVHARIKGDDPLDNAAREHGTLEILRSVVKDLAGPRFYANTLTPAELELLTNYQVAQGAAARRGLAAIEAAGAPKTGPDSADPKWFRLSSHYASDSAFKSQVYETYLSVALRERLRTANQPRPPLGPGGPASESTNDSRSSFGVPGGKTSEMVTNVVITLAVFLALFTYPALAVFLYLGVKLSVARGGLTRVGRGIEEETWTTYNTRYDSQTGQYSRQTHTTTTRVDTYVLGNLSFTVRDGPLDVELSQPVTAVVATGFMVAERTACWLRFDRTGNSYNLPQGCRRARHPAVRASRLWTGLLCAVAFVVASCVVFLSGKALSSEAFVLFGMVGLAWLLLSWTGAAIMGVFHLIGDRRILARARRLAEAR